MLVHNLGYENFNAGNPDAEWYGINQYLLYQLRPTLAANLRAEWFRDDDGWRVLGPGNIPNNDAWNGGGFAGNFYELTAGFKWTPHPNVMVRPEIRWDWYDGARGFRNELPFDGGNGDDQFTTAVDVILTY